MGTPMKRATLTLACWIAAGTTTMAAELADLIQNGDRESALALVAAGGDVNAPQGDGTVPLHWAVYKNDLALVETLLSRGADPNVVNSYGSTPLSEAVNVANADLVERLLDAGADVAAANADGQTAL